MLPPVLATVTGTGTNTILSTCQLDTNLVVVLYRDGSNIKAVAINTSTNVAGTPQTICAYNDANGAAILKASSTSFCAFGAHNSNDGSVRAGSVDAGTLAITLGTVQTTSQAFTSTPIRLTDGLYAFTQNATNGLRAASVSGTAVTLGTAVASGGIGDNSTERVRIAPVSASTFMVFTIAAGGGSTLRALGARRASVSGTTITLDTLTESASQVLPNSPASINVVSLAVGGPWIVAIPDTSVGTTGRFHGVSLSGSAASLSTATSRATDLPASNSHNGAWIHKTGGDAAFAYNATTAAYGHLAAGPYIVTISGTTLTFGSTQTTWPAAKQFMFDLSTGLIAYMASASAFDKITISGTTITSVASAVTSAIATVVGSDGVTDKCVSYSSVYYAWNLPAVAALSATKWLFDSGNDFQLCGPVT